MRMLIMKLVLYRMRRIYFLTVNSGGIRQKHTVLLLSKRERKKTSGEWESAKTKTNVVDVARDARLQFRIFRISKRSVSIHLESWTLFSMNGLKFVWPSRQKRKWIYLYNIILMFWNKNTNYSTTVVHQTYQPKMGPPTKTPIWKGLSAHTIE